MRQAIRAMLDRKLVHERKCARCGVPFISRDQDALICGLCKVKGVPFTLGIRDLITTNIEQ
jgi:ribosomal protein S27AE